MQHSVAYKWKVLAAVVFGIFMVVLDTTVVNVAFPTLRTEFGAPLAEAQAIVSVYVLALGIGTPPAGFLADRYGIKRMYIVGLACFGAGSLLAGFAPSLLILVAARVLQGLGGGIAIPLGSAMLYKAFMPSELGLALGIYGIAILVAPALGPIVGGLLVDAGLWRWIFFVNVPVAATGLIVAARFLRPEPVVNPPGFDIRGLALATTAFGALLHAASLAANNGWTSRQVLLWFAIGTVSGALLVHHELNSHERPLLNLRLFRIPAFFTASLIGYVTVLALFGAEFLMPLYLQALRRQDALQTGLILLPLAITAAITTPLAGRIYDRIGPRPLVVFGFIVLAVNTWQLSKIEAATSIPWIMLLLALRGLALGATVQTTFATALGSVPREIVARGSSLINSTRYVVQAIGVAILSTVLVSRSHAGASVLDAPSLRGFEAAYRLTFFLALLAIPIACFLPGWPGKWQGRTGLAQPQ